MIKSKQQQESEETDEMELTTDALRTDTPVYDAECMNADKLLSATLATFIPRFCKALKEDWYPNLSDKAVQQDQNKREAIRALVLTDWSKESTHHGRGSRGHWTASSIEDFWPDFVIDAEKLQQITKMQRTKALKKYTVFLNRLEAEVQINKLCRVLPEAPEIPAEPRDTGFSMREPLTPEILYEQGVNAFEKAWIAMTGDKIMNDNSMQDVYIDRIKPTRDWRLSVFKGLDKNRAAHYARVLVWIDKLIQDTLKMYRDEISDQQKEIKE